MADAATFATGQNAAHQLVPPGARWGTGATVALALASLQLDVVKKSILHDLVRTHRPAASTSSPQKQREALRVTLVSFERRGWVSRDGDLVRVLNRRALMDFVAAFDDAKAFAWVQAAVLEIRERYNLSSGTPAAARSGQRRRALVRLATEPPRGKGGLP